MKHTCPVCGEEYEYLGSFWFAGEFGCPKCNDGTWIIERPCRNQMTSEERVAEMNYLNIHEHGLRASRAHIMFRIRELVGFYATMDDIRNHWDWLVECAAAKRPLIGDIQTVLRIFSFWKHDGLPLDWYNEITVGDVKAAMQELGISGGTATIS